MHINPVIDASRHFDRLHRDMQAQQAEQEDNRAYARESFDAALSLGRPGVAVWSPRLSNYMATQPLHEIVLEQIDSAALTDLLLLCNKSTDDDVQRMGALILSNIREAHATHCEGAE
jgi:hypothetical protein